MSQPYVSPYPLHTFIRAEEDGDAMTLTYRTEAGELDRFTYGRDGGRLEFLCAMIAICGRRSEPDQVLELYLKRKDQTGVAIMTTQNAEGEVVDPGVEVTHILRLAVKGHDKAVLLSRQLSEFMHGKQAA